MKRTKNMVNNPSIESRELYLFATNTGELWPRVEYVIKSLAKHSRRGRYDADRAVDAWYYIADDASKIYMRLFGYGFTVGERFSAAVELEKAFRDDVAEAAQA